ncbi:MAG: protease [Rhodothermaceae bacterium]|nr:MAG: protease [Rhodothermaceae bacterium]
MTRPIVDTASRTQVHPAFEFMEESGGIEAYRHRTNGLTVLLLRQTAAPVVTFMVTYGVGSRNEGAGLTGATHFLEHLMFKGTERFNRERGTSVFNVLQRVGAQVNATTWFDRTNYYALLPREHLALAVEIEADRMRGARLREEDVESERTVILNEFDRGENEPIRKLYHAVWSLAFVAHPYHHPTIGWRSDIETVTADDLRHFYDTYYWPDNATVSVIGDFEPVQALGLIDRHFGPITPAPAPWPRVVTREPEQRGERRGIVRMAGQLGALMMAYKAPPALATDTDALDVLATALATGKNSRLYRHLTDRGLTTHVYAATSRLRDPGLFYVLAMLAPGRSHEEVEAAIDEVIGDVVREGLREEEVTRARNQLRASEAFGRDGPYAIASQLNEAIAAGDWKLYTTYLDRIAAVTGEDLRRVAAQYLVEDQRTVGWYVPTRDA